MVNAKKLVKFIKLVSLGGSIPTLILQPAEKGVKVAAISPGNTTMCIGLFKGWKIEEQLPIKNVNSLVEAIDFAGGELTLEKVENKLFVSSNKDGKVRSREVGLCDFEYAKSSFAETIPNFEYDGTASISLVDFNDIIGQAEKLKANWIRIKVEENVLSLFAAGDTDAAKITMPLEYHNCVGEFGSPLFEVVKSLTETKVGLSLHKDKDLYPIKISQHDDDHDFYAIIAPKEIT